MPGVVGDPSPAAARERWRHPKKYLIGSPGCAAYRFCDLERGRRAAYLIHRMPRELQSLPRAFAWQWDLEISRTSAPEADYSDWAESTPAWDRPGDAERED